MIAKITKNVTVKIVQANSDYNCNYGETVSVQSSVGPITIHLPKPKENSSISIYDKDGNAATHPITIDAGIYFIDDQNSINLSNNFESISFVSDGFSWKITSRSSSSSVAGGDLSGTYPNPTVEKIKNRSISNVNPAPGQALVWTGSEWTPANLAGVSGSSGGFVYYLNYSDDGYMPPVGSWKEMALIPSSSSYNSSTVSLINSSTYYKIAEFITPESNPSTEIIPAGIWDLNVYLKYDGSINESYFRINVYTWDGVTKTTVATSGDVYITNPSQISVYNCSVRIPNTIINYSDRLGIDVEAARVDGTSVNNFYGYFEGIYTSHIHTTLEAPGGTGVVKVVDGIFQSPASLIADADISVSAAISGSKVTEANATDLGVIKLNGDLDGSAESPKVIAIQNQPVASTIPSSGERLTWTGSVWEAQGDYTFTDDIPVSLSSGKTLGRYVSGETIPATGKTPAEVIQLLAVEPIAPTVDLNTSATMVQFNQTEINNVLNFSYTINSLNATVTSCLLEWRRGGVGSWITLTTDTTNPGIYVHSFTDSNFNTNAFNYRYTVTDSAGATATVTFDIVPVAYAAPTISLSVVGDSITSPETNLKREKGNVHTKLSGLISINSPLVPLANYKLQYQVNGSTWQDINDVNISGSSATISLIDHNPSGDVTATTIAYRVKVVDLYTINYSSTSTINFLNIIFYGPSAAAPANSSDVRSLTGRIFTDGSNPFILNTGDSYVNYTAAMPQSKSITLALDLDALNANITANYIPTTFNVNDAGGTATSYKVYTMTSGVHYDANHRHQITRN